MVPFFPCSRRGLVRLAALWLSAEAEIAQTGWNAIKSEPSNRLGALEFVLGAKGQPESVAVGNILMLLMKPPAAQVRSTIVLHMRILWSHSASAREATDWAEQLLSERFLEADCPNISATAIRAR
jgi:hypothetical protein